jgi:hypothetical protein
MSEPLLKIRNRHSAACGDPPIIDGAAANHYVGYFENYYGEQWVFTCDRESGRCILHGGDVGWNTEFEIIDGQVGDLILSEDERLWLMACCAANRQQKIGD